MSIVPDVMELAAADNVPPRVKLPDVVTVPVKVIPETVPVPLTLVTVPALAPQDVLVPSVLRYLFALPVWLGSKALIAELAVTCPVPPESIDSGVVSLVMLPPVMLVLLIAPPVMSTLCAS